MRDWPAIIEDHRVEGLITDKEAEDLLAVHGHAVEHGIQDEKVAGLLSAIGRKGAQAKNWLLKDNSANMRALGGVAAITAMSAGGLAAVGRAVVDPFAERRGYEAMKAELEKRFPDIISSTPEEDIRAIYHVVRTTSPYMASSPILAAAAVRESIDLPHAMGLDTLKKMVDIQKTHQENISAPGGPFQKAISGASRAGTAAAMGETGKVIAEAVGGRVFRS